MDNTTTDIFPSEEIDFVPDEHGVDAPETNLGKLVNKQSDISDVRYFRRITLAVPPSAAALADVRVNINYIFQDSQRTQTMDLFPSHRRGYRVPGKFCKQGIPTTDSRLSCANVDPCGESGVWNALR